jgi:hypothetical protein
MSILLFVLGGSGVKVHIILHTLSDMRLIGV